MMRQMSERQSPNLSSSAMSHSSASYDLDESVVSDGSAYSSSFNPKPIHWIRELQAEFFGDSDGLSMSPPHLMGDIVSRGIIDTKLSVKLVRLYAYVSSSFFPSSASCLIRESMEG